MKCADVQNSLWSGKRSPDIQEHIHTCFACQKESYEIQQIIGSLRSIEIPKPTRSLIPSPTMIKETVAANRKKPVFKLTKVAAAATVLLATATGVSLYGIQAADGLRNHQSTQEIPQSDVLTENTDKPKVEVRDGAGNREMLAAIQNYLAENTNPKEVKQIKIHEFVPKPKPEEPKSKPVQDPVDPEPKSEEPMVTGYVALEVELQPKSTSEKFTDSDGIQTKDVVLTKQSDQTWAVAAFDTEKGPNVRDRIQLYFDKDPKASGAKLVKVTDFQADPQTDQNIMTGKATLEVELEPNAKSSYQQGSNTRFLLLTRTQGVWDVMKVGTEPFTVDDAPPYYRDFEKVAQKLQGSIVDVQINTAVGPNFLDSITIKVEKNLTKTNPTFKPGDTVKIVYGDTLTQSLTIPQKGDRVVVHTAQTNPAISAGQEMWYGKLNYYFHQRDGKYYDYSGEVTVDPAKE
ncbi:hypothetical protein [Effusibacillus lacus]|uniref:Uncharacterized protein n=1 Tax=Effusibacillus lacus TaxID=1348429 RepID=A0A292YCI7_9BACL|nr:hypothetical protein [Effusibacillus lacus]TCS69437.1 hypothetical protein EDD64_13764 [Effusibacillus lacus]GAX89202.1 hypothetical protein EFBL_0820 [Effusibacillus lacus]